MTDERTRTRDPSLATVQADSLLAMAGQAVPRLRLLYHPDLGRIGAVSHADADFEAGQWLDVGRSAPLFATSSPGDVWSPLADPTISRTQLRVRWLRDLACFEVEPAPSAKRKLYTVRDESSPAECGDEVAQRVQLPVGAMLAIEDRVLIGLEVLSQPHSIEEDRIGLVGETDEIWRLRQEIVEVGRFQKPVLVLGETGTGKELVANAIHRASPRHGGPFVPVNCAALPEHLVESVLFGHVRGAFTGADASREGLFRAAAGGTLFLDELCEMPIAIQPKLLRTLQDGMVTAVGQNKSVLISVRLVAATNRDPAVEMSAGRLRADLYHRLSTHVIAVPKLCSRRFDIPALFVHFFGQQRQEHPELNRLWREGQRQSSAIPMSFFLALLRYDWPGNVRELENIVEQTARRNQREGAFIAPLLPLSRSDTSAAEPSPPSAAAAAHAGTTLDQSVRRPPVANERPPAQLGEVSRLLGIARKTLAKLIDLREFDEMFGQAEEAGEADAARLAPLRAKLAANLHAILATHDFNQARVAKTLGVSAWTLIRLMQELGLRRPSDLSEAEIRAALDGSCGDITQAATLLNVSEHGLKKRLFELGLEAG